MKRLTEKQFLSQVIQLARLCGWLVYHTHDSRRSAAGFPDLVLARAGRLVAAELKVGRRRPTHEQQAWLDALRRAGVAAYLWYPEHWPLIERILTD